MGRKASSKEDIIRKIVSERQPVGKHDLFHLAKCYKSFAGFSYSEIVDFAKGLDFIFTEEPAIDKRQSLRFSIKG